MKSLLPALSGLVLCVISFSVPNVSHAVDFTNSLYRCTRSNRATLCFDAKSVPSTMNESCNMLMSRTRLERVHGGGLYFGPTPDADDTAYPSVKCNIAIVTSAYDGFITPCAPGGPAGWTHRSRHSVLFILNEPIEEARVRTYPLPQSTCEGGGPLD